MRNLCGILCGILAGCGIYEGSLQDSGEIFAECGICAGFVRDAGCGIYAESLRNAESMRDLCGMRNLRGIRVIRHLWPCEYGLHLPMALRLKVSPAYTKGDTMMGDKLFRRVFLPKIDIPVGGHALLHASSTRYTTRLSRFGYKIGLTEFVVINGA